MTSPDPSPASSPDPRTGAERRRHARARAEWPIKVMLAGGEADARIRDVSRSGISFFLDRPIPEMTLLEVAFELPGGAGGKRRMMTGQGAVVRCEKISAALDHYEIAVFLTEMPDRDREAIESFVALS